VTWLERLKTFGEGVIENNPNKDFGKIKEVLGELMTKETMYFYLIDELTGLPVRGDGYPIVITTPSEIVHKLLPVMQLGMRAMSVFNGVAGVARIRWLATPCRRCPRSGARAPSLRSRCSSRCVSEKLKLYRTLCMPKHVHSTCIADSNLTYKPHCIRRRRALSRSLAPCTPR